MNQDDRIQEVLAKVHEIEMRTLRLVDETMGGHYLVSPLTLDHDWLPGGKLPSRSKMVSDVASRG